MDKNAKIGFIGTGVMGLSMAYNIIKEGYSISVYSRTREKALYLIEQGAAWKESVKELAGWADIIITMVGFPKDVEEVYLKDNGIIKNARKGSYIVDMTTSKPSLARNIYIQAKQKGIFALDAPVSGGDIGAKNATLAIMVGGDKDAFDYIKPLLMLMGNNIMLQGGPGSGQHCKMCNQVAVAANIMGVCELLAYSKKAGLNPDNVLKSVTTGAAASWQLSVNAKRILEGDYNPGFYIKHFVKDLSIALEEAELMGLEMPVVKLANSLYEKMIENNKGNLGTQALYQLYSDI